MMRFKGRCTSATLGLVLLASPAFADGEADIDAEARAAYDHGAEAYEAKDFKRASALLSRADALSPNPVTLKLALAAALQADDAVVTMNLALRAERRAVDGSLADLAREARKRSQEKVGIVRIVCASRDRCRARIGEGSGHDGDRVAVAPGPVDIDFDDGRNGGATTPRRLRLNVAAATIVDAIEPRVPLAGSSDAGSSDAGARRRGDVARPTSALDRGAGLSPAFFWGGIALTAALGGVTIASGIDAQGQHEDFMASSPRLPEDRERGEAAETRTNVLLVSTVASALVTSLVGLVFTRWHATKAPARSARGVDGS